MQQFLHDVFYHLRTLRRRWSFTLLIVLCLALGVGANSTVFSIVNAVLLRPLPFEDAEQLFVLFDVRNDDNYNISPANLFEWRQRSTSFTGIEALQTRYFIYASAGSPERLPGGAITAGLFDLLGVEPMMGRTFQPEEDLPGGPRVVLLSHGAFVRRFGADPKILGQQVDVDGESHTVVGVMPPGAEKFIPPRFMVEGAELWVPLALDPAARAQYHNLYAVSRLAPGVTHGSALAEMQALASQLAQEFPNTNAGWGANVVGLRENWVGSTRRNLMLLFAAVVFVLLIACANVANLLLTRATEQQGEIALRMSFGAGRRHVVRHFTMESILLAIFGGVVGLALAALTLRMLPLLLPARLHHQLRDVDLDTRVLLFTFLVSLLAGVVPGLLAAWRVSSKDLLPKLNEGGQRSSVGVSGRRLRDGLMVLEIALTLVLLIGGGLMIKSLSRLGQSPIGFDPQNILTFSISLPGSLYASFLPGSRFADPAATTAFYRQVTENIKALPGVNAVGVTSKLPINRYASTAMLEIEDRVPEQPGERLAANYRMIDPDYFETLGIPLLEGRRFSISDDSESLPVAVVSQEMAERYWPGGQALGRRVSRVSDTWITIVGIVAEVQDDDMGAQLGGGRGTLYVPYSQGVRPTMYLAVRSTVEPTSLVPAIRQAVTDVEALQPIANVETLEERIGSSLSSHRFNTFLLMAFSGLSVILALTGIYGLLSYSVGQRTREMGMRMALGATARDIVALVLRQTIVLSLLGLGVGVLLALFLSRLLRSLLYEVEPTDPMVFLGTFMAMALTCVAAGLRPAWRAARCDPAMALKDD